MNVTYSLSDTCTLFHADCRDALKVLPDNCLDSCVTDPPYALVSIVKRFGSATSAPAKGNDAYMRASAGFMGKMWDTGETAMSVEFWAEVLRVLKPGAFVAAFGSSRGYHRMACAIEDAGFEVRDSLMWVYGTGFPKSHSVSLAIDKAERGVPHGGADTTSPNHGKFKGGCSDDNERGQGFGAGPGQFMAEAGVKVERDLSETAAEWEGWGTALKPAFEPIVLARKPLSEGTVAANVLRWRTGALNIDRCRVPGEPWKAHDATGLGSVKFFSEGKTPVIHKEPHDGGRWPANVVHDGSDEVVGAFPANKPTAAHKTKRSADAGNRIDYGTFNGQEDVTIGYDRPGESTSTARFFYSAKASKADRNGSKHPTVKPIALMQWLARLITPPGGVLLDPFAGSGTTGQAAANEGFRCILVERETEYVADIVRRLGTVDSPPLAPE